VFKGVVDFSDWFWTPIATDRPIDRRIHRPNPNMTPDSNRDRGVGRCPGDKCPDSSECSLKGVATPIARQ